MKDFLIYLLFVYIGVVNVVGFILPAVDKRRAKKDRWRIRESTLFLVSVLGGSVAMYISMRLFHHKTKHKRFMIGIPVIIVLQVVLITAVWYFFFR